MTNTLYSRAASAVDPASPSGYAGRGRAAARQPNNEKITEMDVAARAADPASPSGYAGHSPTDDDDTSTLPGSLGQLARQLRNAIGIMSESEMAAILQVSHETLATWRTKRRGPPHVKIGKRAFYLMGDFSQWVMGEVERQAALNSGLAGHKQHRKRQRKPEHKAKQERDDHVIIDADAQASLPLV